MTGLAAPLPVTLSEPVYGAPDTLPLRGFRVSFGARHPKTGKGTGSMNTGSMRTGSMDSGSMLV